MVYLAHISEDGREHRLEDHLRDAAKLAKDFAKGFGAGEMAHFITLLHDVGKVQDKFQERLRDSKVRCDHSTPSAKLASKLINMKGEGLDREAQIAAFCIAGHHTGLPDLGEKTDTASNFTLKGRMKRRDVLADFDLKAVFEKPLEFDIEIISQIDTETDEAFLWRLSFYIRMLFSCLVDADFLDTEYFMKAGKAGRLKEYSLHDLDLRLDKYLEEITSNASKSELNQVRSEILDECRKNSICSPGLFNLTVPTGGGKTLSSLSWALKHAVENGLKRIIYIIPYTSIIDQTVRVFQKAVGEDMVLAHHSNVDFDPEEDEANDLKVQQQKLATENWDYPIIVTTAVQFFESLFAARTSRCRKLHNLSEAVMIFDEVQMLPINYLRMCLAGILEFTARYRSSAVFCTATQPELEHLIREDPFLQELLGEQKIKDLVSSDSFQKKMLPKSLVSIYQRKDCKEYFTPENFKK